MDKATTPLDRKILIADRDMQTRKYIRGMLNELGYRTVEEAPNEAQALEWIGNQEQRPHIVIASWGNESEFSPFDIIAKIQEGGQSLPVILISDKTDAASVMKAREAGVHAYLAKPFTLAQLKSKLARAGQQPVIPVSS